MEGRVLDNTSNRMIRVLVAEDDSFQQLALVDLLSISNCDVVAVENGKLAVEELMKEDANFDIVLLDLMMPEMDGLEVLTMMQGNEKLRNIPVVMMSSDGEQQSVATCLEHGAKDYFVKPIRIGKVKSLSKYVNSSNKKSDNKSSGDQFERIKLLGRGAAGSVELVKRVTDGAEFAMKIIPIQLMSAQERKAAENEVILLKVLSGPTIIRYFNSFTEKNNLYIVMEYAEGGSLTERITEKRTTGEHFTKDQILNWAAQMIIGLMFMHSKNILHRDIKSQNMFLTKGDIVKLGDFGISKALGTAIDFAKTSCGTPYNMSPEVCRGEAYGQKADIWALGVTLYELAALKRPFQHDHIAGLFELIKEAAPDTLPESTDPDVIKLIQQMLHKDPTKRPSIWDLAKIPCITERINQFVEENKCKDEVASVLDLDPSKNNNKKPGLLKQNSKAVAHEEPKIEQIKRLSKKELYELADNMRAGIELRNVKTGIFTTMTHVVTGEDISNWLEQNNHITNSQEIKHIVEDLLDQHLLHVVNGDPHHHEFHNSPRVLYRFQADQAGNAANMFRIWRDECRPANQLASELISKMNDILRDSLPSKEEDLVNLIAKIKKGKSYLQYMELSAELQGVNIQALQKNEKIAFFLNMYQLMYVHEKLNKMESPPQLQIERHDILMMVGRFVSQSLNKDKFVYNISGKSYSLDDIVHGILRGNKAKPGSILGGKYFSAKDTRSQLVQIRDCRISLIFYQGDSFPKRLEAYDSANYEEKLEKIVKAVLKNNVIYDELEEEVYLPPIFRDYRQDFPSDDAELLKWIWKYFRFHTNIESVLKGVKEKRITIEYSE